MIHFFRTIRNQLLSQKKFRKYLLYATGEIVLVVIGILIALLLPAVQAAREAGESDVPEAPSASPTGRKTCRKNSLGE